MLRSMLGAAVVAAVTILPATWQWLKIPAATVPKGPDGKPNLSAPAPRLFDGKPDLSWIWNPNPKYVRDFAVDLKPDAIVPVPMAVEESPEAVVSIPIAVDVLPDEVVAPPIAIEYQPKALQFAPMAME